MLYLQYGLVAAAVLAVAAGFYRVVLPISAPDFLEKPILDTERLLFEIGGLAYRARVVQPRGAGLSVRLIKKQIDRAFHAIGQKAASGKSELFGFEHWLYDNHYKLRERIAAIKREAHKFAFLPHTDGLPRVYLFCELLVKSSGGYVDYELLKRAVARFHEETPLSYPEIMAMRSALEFALLEYIAIFAAKSVKIDKLTEKARLDAERGRADLVSLRYNSYADTLYRYSSERARRNIAKLCENNGASVISRGESFYVSIARYDGAVASAVKSLHNIPEILTDKNLIALSPVHSVLTSESQSQYDTLTQATQFLYLYHIYKQATRRRISEPACVKEALQSALQHSRDISFEILPREKGRGFAAIYILIHLALTAAISIAVGCFSWQYGVVAAILCVPISFLLAGLLCADAIKSFVKRRELPAKALKAENRADCPTLIAVPRLVADKAEISDAFQHIETIIAANPDPVFTYALVFDFPSAPREEADGDKELLDACRLAFETCAYQKRLSLLVRKRTQVAGEAKFQGWEKKRGALIDLNALLLDGVSERFRLHLGAIPRTKYVVTLDCDTLINSCMRLVEIMEHPFNADKHVVSVQINSMAAAERCTAFSRLFCGAAGLSHYTVYNSSGENDLFAKGNFTGKGIYRVDAFQKAVAHAFFDNRLLCHDYIEGCFAGCANAAETALDEFPESFGRFFVRQTRWLKGDWQLLPFLGRKVRGRDGKLYKNPISAIHKWHILSNMVHSLVPIASLLLIALSLFATKPFILLGVAFSPYAVYLLKAARLSVLRLSLDFFYELFRQIFLFAAMPVIAMYSFCAILLTLWRLISRKKLLEWKTFSHAKGRVSFLPAIISGALLAVAAYFTFAPLIFYSISALFMFGFLLDLSLSHTPKQKPVRDFEFRKQLIEDFKTAYRYFTDRHMAQYNFLPCDNLQAATKPRLAERTSPTNIGFAIVAHISAYLLDIIDRKTMIKFCSDIIETVKKLPKWCGNLYNWIDIQSLQTLSPRYVSSVDSGNLLIALTLLSQNAEGTLKQDADRLIAETQLEQLYDHERGLFYIGYNDDTKETDAGHYDLLASESLSTYLIAIAHGKIGSECIGNLSRQSFSYGRNQAFCSWTGGMFEYLMPALFFDFRPKTEIAASCRAAVRMQIHYAKERKLPAWGISESQYAKTDSEGNYQYRAFGIPQLALANNPCPSVVAPYASLLSLPFAPADTVKENLSILKKKGVWGEYGYCESVDFSENQVMRTFMAHHIGMSLAAIANYVTAGAIIKTMRRNAGVRAAELTLSGSGRLSARRKRQACSPVACLAIPSPIVTKLRYSIPRINLLCAGRYALITDSRGNGYAMYDEIPVTRCGATELVAEFDGKQYNLLSGTFSASYESSVYEQSFDKFSSKVSISLLASGNGEAREVCIVNRTDSPLNIVLKSKIEPVLRDRAGDIAHRAYSDLFLRAEYDPLTETIKMHRKTAKIPYYVTHSTVSEYKTIYNTERRAYYGRGNNALCVQEYPVEPILSAHTFITLLPRQKVQATVFTVCAYDQRVLSNEIRSVKSHGFLAANRTTAAAMTAQNRVSPLTSEIAAKLLYGAVGSVCDGTGAELLDTTVPALYYRIGNERSLPRIKTELCGIKKLYKFGITFHLYLLYNERHSYFMTQNEAINAMLDEIGYRSALNAQSGVFLVNETEEPHRARAVAENAVKISELECIPIPERPKQKQTRYPHISIEAPLTIKELGIGGITADYAFAVDLTDCDTPRPYCNVLANGAIGSIVTESGGGYTFYENSRQKKLTAWSNDSVLDTPSEWIAICERGACWSITKNPAKIDGASYHAVHGLGYSEFLCGANAIRASQTVFVAKERPVKFMNVTLENAAKESRVLEVMLAVNPVLGDFPEYTRQSLSATLENGVLCMENRTSGLRAFVHASETIAAFSTCREAFTDGEGRIVPLDGRVSGCEFFPAVSVKISLSAGEKKRICFAIGAEPAVDFSCIDKELSEVRRHYETLSGVRIAGNSGEAVLSRWLAVQMYASRFLARAGFYQAGGAIGFRDQLQDCLGLLYVNPDLVRRHILTCAARQFEEGDVLHWWHEPSHGVRTRISDDRLFLPLVTARYIAFTGDAAILERRVPYLVSKLIESGKKDLYTEFVPAQHSGTLYEHCIKAIEISCDFGKNGLCRMGGGDWNDGMDEVGAKGIGTSVFVSQLLHWTICEFVPHVRDIKHRARLMDIADKTKRAVQSAFEGDRFVRAYTDEGKVLGSKKSTACKLDLLTQSFAALSKTGTLKQCKSALLTCEERLFDPEYGIIKLLDPPFIDEKDIGYIADYPPGVRENGGQYTHAAVWFVLALLKIGETERAWQYFQALSPLSHTETRQKALRYGNEPYVLSADIYAGAHAGRGGWSWYTGAASWYYVCLIEGFLGIKIRGTRMSIAPNLPDSVPKLSFVLRINDRDYDITIDNTAQKGDWRLKIDKMLYTASDIELTESLSEKKITVARVV